MRAARNSDRTPRRARAVRAKCSLAGLTITHAARATVVKPARLHFARTAREASCPNFEPRAHARLTGLTSATGSGQSKQFDNFVMSYLIDDVNPQIFDLRSEANEMSARGDRCVASQCRIIYDLIIIFMNTYGICTPRAPSNDFKSIRLIEWRV